MISRINKKNSNSSEEGVTLFLAILVLSSILAISFSLATILFIEVRTSSDLTRTEGALAGANGVAEQALFNIKRSVPCGTSCYVTNFQNHVTLASGTPQTTNIASPSFVDRVIPSSNTILNTRNKYNFCDINTLPSQGCGYGKVTITYEPTGNTDPLVVLMCEFDATGNVAYATAPCSDPNDTSSPGYWLSGTGGTVLNDGDTPLTFNFSPNLQQELILYNGVNNSTRDIFVQIQTYDDSGQFNPKGLPYANKTAVAINAVNAQVGRKIKVVIPNPGSSGPSGTTDFAAASNGGVASASSFLSASYPIADINDGDRLGNNWGNGGTGGGWNDGAGPPSWAEVDFSGAQSISKIEVFTLANCAYPSASCASIDSATPADLEGIADFQVQYDNGGIWQTVSGGAVSGNNLAWREFTFPSVTTSKIRVVITAAHDTYSRLVELEAY